MKKINGLTSIIAILVVAMMLCTPLSQVNMPGGGGTGKSHNFF